MTKKAVRTRSVAARSAAVRANQVIRQYNASVRRMNRAVTDLQNAKLKAAMNRDVRKAVEQARQLAERLPTVPTSRVTEDEADAISEMLESDDLVIGRDIARDEWPDPIGRGRGRPSLTAPGEESPQVRARVPAETKARLDALAALEERSTSDLVREAIDEYLDVYGP